MDMVFSDTGDLHGGFYDNNGGLVRRFPCFLRFLPARLRAVPIGTNAQLPTWLSSELASLLGTDSVRSNVLLDVTHLHAPPLLQAAPSGAGLPCAGVRRHGGTGAAARGARHRGDGPGSKGEQLSCSAAWCDALAVLLADDSAD